MPSDDDDKAREQTTREIIGRIQELNETIESHRVAMSDAKQQRMQCLDELKDLGWSGSDIARWLGVSRQRVSQLRHGG